MRETTKTAALRTWLTQRIEVSTYAIEQLKAFDGSAVLANHVELLARYQATILALDEYDEWLSDSSG
jgi:hypothetical protein